MPDLLSHTAVVYIYRNLFPKLKLNRTAFWAILFGTFLPDLISRGIVLIDDKYYYSAQFFHTPLACVFQSFVICFLFVANQRITIFFAITIGWFIHQLIDLFQTSLDPFMYTVFWPVYVEPVRIGVFWSGYWYYVTGITVFVAIVTVKNYKYVNLENTFYHKMRKVSLLSKMFHVPPIMGVIGSILILVICVPFYFLSVANEKSKLEQLSSYTPGDSIPFIHTKITKFAEDDMVIVGDFLGDVVKTNLKRKGFTLNQKLVLSGKMDIKGELLVQEFETFPFFTAKKVVSVFAFLFLLWKFFDEIKISKAGLELKKYKVSEM